MTSGERNVAHGLRAQILAIKPQDLGIAPTTELPRVWAALMEWSQSKTMVTLVAVADGATSLYIGTGGGVIGGHAHESVRAANRKFLTAIDKVLSGFVKVAEPLPVIEGAVSFTALAYDGRWGIRDTEVRLQQRTSPAWPLYFIGHEVIGALRLVSEKQPR